ncbi:MAG: type IV pilin protein [Pseudomonadales bacterium]
MHGFSVIELLIAMAVMAILGSIAVPLYDTYVERARVGQAVADIGRIDMQIERFVANNFRYPDSLAEVGAVPVDPWGNPYRFLRITGNGAPGLQGQLRKDRNLVPINSDYDLYSVGADADTRPPLTARSSRDDIVRASDGGFVGLAEEF